MKVNITEIAIKNRKITLFIVIAAAIFGIYSYYIAPKQEAPDVTAPFAVITAVYPGSLAGGHGKTGHKQD